MGAGDRPGDMFGSIASLAAECGLAIDRAEFAWLADREGFGVAELAAIEALLAHHARKSRDIAVGKRLAASRLPLREPKTFENFDFTRVQGSGVEAIGKLDALVHLHARKSIAFIGPGGVGKTHLAQAYGRKCCEQGFTVLWLKANELRDKLEKALAKGNAGQAVRRLVNPACLIIDEVGRCTFDLECTNLFFDIVDRRYDKEMPNTLILTSNTPVVNWDRFFTGDDTLLCALDRIFDKASVFLMKGQSFRGAQCETYSLETRPSIMRPGS